MGSIALQIDNLPTASKHQEGITMQVCLKGMNVGHADEFVAWVRVLAIHGRTCLDVA
jgi:hypothetical protein